MGRNSRSRGGAWEIPYCIGRRPIFQPLTMNAGWEVEGSEKVSLPAADCSAPCSGTCRARPGLAQGDAAGGNEGSQGYSVHLGRKMQSSAGKKEEKKPELKKSSSREPFPPPPLRNIPPRFPSPQGTAGHYIMPNTKGFQLGDAALLLPLPPSHRWRLADAMPKITN